MRQFWQSTLRCQMTLLKTDRLFCHKGNRGYWNFQPSSCLKLELDSLHSGCCVIPEVWRFILGTLSYSMSTVFHFKWDFSKTENLLPYTYAEVDKITGTPSCIPTPQTIAFEHTEHMCSPVLDWWGTSTQKIVIHQWWNGYKLWFRFNIFYSVTWCDLKL